MSNALTFSRQGTRKSKGLPTLLFLLPQVPESRTGVPTFRSVGHGDSPRHVPPLHHVCGHAVQHHLSGHLPAGPLPSSRNGERVREVKPPRCPCTTVTP